MLALIAVQAPPHLGPTGQPPPLPVDRAEQFQSSTRYQVMNKQKPKGGVGVVGDRGGKKPCNIHVKSERQTCGQDLKCVTYSECQQDYQCWEIISVWEEERSEGGGRWGQKQNRLNVCEKCFTQVSFTRNCHHCYFPRCDDGGKCWMTVVMVLMSSLVQLPWSYSIP